VAILDIEGVNESAAKNVQNYISSELKSICPELSSSLFTKRMKN
jgi:hypothetical protein